jgi:anthranilate/para-aminobenzoate synthase component I
MGTVSGAPKVRAMQIIHKHEEGRPRGLYAGSFGFIGLGGGAQFVVGLRSLMKTGTELRIGAGAGIIHDSVPRNEYDETEAKMQIARSVIAPFLKRS